MIRSLEVSLTPLNTIQVCDRDSKKWLLRPGRYHVYSMSESVMATSTEPVTPQQSSTGIAQLTLAIRVKVEHTEELITIFNDDLDRNSPTVASPIRSPLVNCSLLESSERSPIPLNQLVTHVGNQKSLSIVDSLKRIQDSKGAKSVFKNLDFDNLDIQRVQFLPPNFNGNVMFKLPPIDMFGF